MLQLATRARFEAYGERESDAWVWSRWREI